MDDELLLLTVNELIERIRKHSFAYSLLLVRRDEDAGMNGTQTLIFNFESQKLQCFGLAHKINEWLSNRLEKVEPPDNVTPPSFDDAILKNVESKKIIEVISKRSLAIIGGIIFKDGEKFMFQNDDSKGQSLGLSFELLDYVRTKMS